MVTRVLPKYQPDEHEPVELIQRQAQVFGEEGLREPDLTCAGRGGVVPLPTPRLPTLPQPLPWSTDGAFSLAVPGGHDKTAFHWASPKLPTDLV